MDIRYSQLCPLVFLQKYSKLSVPCQGTSTMNLVRCIRIFGSALASVLSAFIFNFCYQSKLVSRGMIEPYRKKHITRVSKKHLPFLIADPSPFFPSNWFQPTATYSSSASSKNDRYPRQNPNNYKWQKFNHQIPYLMQTLFTWDPQCTSKTSKLQDNWNCHQYISEGIGSESKIL